MASATEATSVARTITAEQWDSAIRERCTLGPLNEAITRCMAELCQPSLSPARSMTPWLPLNTYCQGVMWAGVPKVADSWRDKEGSWIISVGAVRPARDNYYIRLCPAPPDAEVQFGFCTVRQDKIKEALKQEFGSEDLLQLRQVCISSRKLSLFRIDKMITAAVRLFGSRCPAGQQFRSLFTSESISFHSFIVSMMERCYMDGRELDVLRNRSQTYKEMIRLVVVNAYGDFLSSALAGVRTDRFVAAMGLSGVQWDPTYLQPFLHNIVMPRVIFDVVDRNLERGIPPIVPQYVTPSTWMFNGCWADPCTGLNLPPTIPYQSKKIIGGVTGVFNCDLPGPTSYWEPKANPPDRWVLTFLDCLEDLGKETLSPAPYGDKADLALFHARRIPAMFDIPGGTPKFARLVDMELEPVTKVVTRECDASGRNMIGDVTVTETGVATKDADDDEDTHRCISCREFRSSEETSACSVCDSLVCEDCSRYCETCESEFCPACDESSNHACAPCTDCGDITHSSDMRHCMNCQQDFCEACVTGCTVCGDWYCGQCREDGTHECEGV